MANWITLISTVLGFGGTIATVVIQTRSSNREITAKLETQQAVTETKLQTIEDKVEQLGKRVDAHNHFNDRITRLEVKEEARCGRNLQS